MTDWEETTADVAQSDGEEKLESASKDRSTIKFPYGDLADAVGVATSIKQNFSNQCGPDQLAAALGFSPSSSGFRTRVATAVIFGLVTNKQRQVSLTDLGHRVADERTRAAALVDAFLEVELFRRVYEDHMNRSLPGDAGLEAHIRTLGVAQKQVDRARRSLQRSAQTAGLFWSGRERLVKPPISNTGLGPALTPADPAPVHNVDQESTGAPLASDPVITGMLAKLPAHGNFPRAERDRWLKTFSMILDVVYGPTETDSPSE